MTKYIGKRIYVKKEAEIVAKNLFRIHSEQKVIFIRLSERRIEPDSARLYLGLQAHRTAPERIDSSPARTQVRVSAEVKREPAFLFFLYVKGWSMLCCFNRDPFGIRAIRS